ncbi:arginine--tRNA ligase [Candidatus Bipolaricaulota bacterium]
MLTHLEALVVEVVGSAYRTVFGAEPVSSFLEIRPTDRPEFGDYTSNIAMLAASELKIAPREIGSRLVQAISEQIGANSSHPVGSVELAGPGFINLFLKMKAVQGALRQVFSKTTPFGTSTLGEGKKLQVEFVSSNPTGPLTVGHGRQAVLGDVLATLYEHLGYDVHREYYFNDEGRQVDLLAKSLWVRYQGLSGDRHEIPEDGYQGEYLISVARDLSERLERSFPSFDTETEKLFRAEAVDRMTDLIKDDLEELGVRFDTWFSEASLHQAGKIDATLKLLREKNGVYEDEGAVWLKAEEYGGAKDSVLIRSDGRPTYLMVDIAYHIDKHERGFDHVLNVQGADHHAEQTCVKAAMRLLGYPDGWLSYGIHQFVSLKEGGQVQKMSTRAGRFVTLRDLVNDLGKDVVRYFMISRKPEAHLDFDLDLARAESADNPSTYIQYAYTRIRSIFRKIDSSEPQDVSQADLSLLREAEELGLIKTLDQFPQIIAHAALDFAPHALAEYGLNLSRAFHAYYDKHRVLIDDAALQEARLTLLSAIQIVLGECLAILGMDAPEEM